MSKTLYAMSKTGKTLMWTATSDGTLNSDGFVELNIESGQLDGKHTHKVRYVKKGMNVGKSNETSIYEQARLELHRLYTKQYDKGYVDDVNNINITKQVGDIPKPTLADNFADNVHKLPKNTSDIVRQPKIDGVRCFITKLDDESIRFTSRSGKLIPNIKVIENDVKNVLNVGDIIDGELFIEGYELEEIISVVMPSKNIKSDEIDNVILYWFDFIPKDKGHEPYVSRFLNIDIKFGKSVQKIESHQYDYVTIERDLTTYINNGYEGLIVRDIQAQYFFGRRTSSLLKYKRMHSAEFEIVDIIPSKQDNAPRFICALDDGKTVTVRLVGDKDDNMKYFNDKESFIGSYLTIKFQKRTKKGSLQFPVGIAVRDGEVVDGVFVPSL